MGKIENFQSVSVLTYLVDGKLTASFLSFLGYLVRGKLRNMKQRSFIFGKLTFEQMNDKTFKTSARSLITGFRLVFSCRI